MNKTKAKERERESKRKRKALTDFIFLNPMIIFFTQKNGIDIIRDIQYNDILIVYHERYISTHPIS